MPRIEKKPKSLPLKRKERKKVLGMRINRIEALRAGKCVCEHVCICGYMCVEGNGLS